MRLCSSQEREEGERERERVKTMSDYSNVHSNVANMLSILSVVCILIAKLNLPSIKLSEIKVFNF